MSNINNTQPRSDIQTLVNTESTWRTWHIRDVYRGPNTGKFVPNPGDHVVDDTGGVRRVYRVTTIDAITRVAELERLSEDNAEDSRNKRMRGVGPGHNSEIWRCYHDKSLVPHTLRPDDNLFFHGEDVAYYKIFLGQDDSEKSGIVISQYHDRNTGTVSENVPVTRAYRDFAAVSVPTTCNTTHELEDGEIVTIVGYTASGKQTSSDTLLIVNTAEVRRTESARRQIADIELLSSHLSRSADKLIEFPVNMAKEQLHFMCRITYADGSHKDLAIDGTRVKLLGLDAWMNTVRGQEAELVLTYSIPDDEDSLMARNTHKRHIAVTYTARTTEAEGAYSVKLYPIPVFAGGEWSLRYFMYNLDRNTNYDVTEHVQLGVNAQPFNPTRFGATQRVVVSLNLRDVDPNLARYQHAQAFDIVLSGRPTEVAHPFYITYQQDQEPNYGRDVFINISQNRQTNAHQMTIQSACQNQEEWLEKLYYRALPMFNPDIEAKAPKPTHFILNYGLNQISVPIEQWNRTIELPERMVIGSTVRVEWVVKSTDQTSLICSTPVIVKQ